MAASARRNRSRQSSSPGVLALLQTRRPEPNLSGAEADADGPDEVATIEIHRPPVDEFADNANADSTPSTPEAATLPPSEPVVPETPSEPSTAVPAPEPPAQEPEAAPAAVVQPSRFRVYAQATYTVLKRVDWVAVGILASIPTLIGAAYLFGALPVTVGIVSLLLVAAMVRVVVTQVWAEWTVSRLVPLPMYRKPMLRTLLRVSAVIGIGILLLTGIGWQPLMGCLVLYLFADRLVR